MAFTVRGVCEQDGKPQDIVKSFHSLVAADDYVVQELGGVNRRAYRKGADRIVYYDNSVLGSRYVVQISQEG